MSPTKANNANRIAKDSPRTKPAISLHSLMAANKEEIARELLPLGICLYKSGKVDRKLGTEFVPPSLDPATGVHSRDILINSTTNLSARIYLPKAPQNKLPLLINFHGGGFCIESAFSPLYHPFCNSLAASANVLIVSVNYRLAPDNPIQVPYDDSWEAIKWVVSQSENDEWLSEYADFDRVYFAGDSAGANIAHHMAVRVESEGLPGACLAGIVLIHPYFWGTDAIESGTGDENSKRLMGDIWLFASSDSSGLGLDDPLINPNIDPKYFSVGCDRVLVFVAEEDVLRDRGRDYYEKLQGSEWKGEVKIYETKGENHVFHLFYPASENARDFLKQLGSFLNGVGAKL